MVAGEVVAVEKKTELGAPLRAQFPIFKNNERNVQGKTLPLVYLDSAVTAQKPISVISAIREHMEKSYGAVHRGVYELSARSSEIYERARTQVANFVSPLIGPDEIVFTRGSTESLNILANGIGEALLSEGDRIVVPAFEHHANLLPWQQVAMRKNCEIAYIPLKGRQGNDLALDVFAAEKLISKNTKVVALAHIGNVMGQINPLREIARLAKNVGALVIVDAAQGIASSPEDAFALGADAIAFSGHKMYGPSGIGVLAAKRSLLEAIPPLIYGGGMIQNVTLEGCELAAVPAKFEAGSPPMTEVVGLSEAIRFIEKLGRETIHAHSARLAAQFHRGLEGIAGIEIFSPSTGHENIVSFRHVRVHAHDLATFLDSDNVAMRAGHHCAWPLIRSLGVDALVRASFAAYNDEDDVESALRAIKKAVNFL